MRNVITLIVSATLLTACADDPHPTSPATRSSGASADLRPVNEAGAAQSKPVDQVGFTKISYVYSGPGALHMTAGSGQTAAFTVACPIGTTVMNGGYKMTLWDAAAVPPIVATNGPEGNGWKVMFVNEAAGTMPFTFYIYTACVS